MAFRFLCVLGTHGTHHTFMLQLNICSTLAPGLVSWHSESSNARCQYPGGDSLFLVGICCKLFGEVLFMESKEGPLGTRSGLEGRWLIKLTTIIHYELPVLLAVWGPVSSRSLDPPGMWWMQTLIWSKLSLLGYWYQFPLHLDTSLDTMGQIILLVPKWEFWWLLCATHVLCLHQNWNEVFSIRVCYLIFWNSIVLLPFLIY